MTNAERLLDLAERCERAEGPDRELDALAHQALGYRLREAEPHERHQDRRRWVKPDGLSCGWLENSNSGYPPAYTASLVAAMTLVPEGCFPLLDCDPRKPEAEILRHTDDHLACLALGVAATPALALCAASLRAIAKENDHD